MIFLSSNQISEGREINAIRSLKLKRPKIRALFVKLNILIKQPK